MGRQKRIGEDRRGPHHHLPLFLLLSIASLLVMVVVDYFLGAKAEFMNTWSVFERLVGRAASAGDSAVYRSLGAAGELLCVVLVNAAIGGVLTVVSRLFVGK